MLAGGVDGGFDALEHQPATAKVCNVSQHEYPAIQNVIPRICHSRSFGTTDPLAVLG